ncbi:MAG: type II toxin-antitoxin system HicB family antitoxin [Candidatus Poribacteria bacterium]|nr:type II toxin-antitoxin system HicB family antitoxin [Candidatus Poribacteria bacterium]
MRCKLTLILEEQPEGGFTITCQELPELITECDSLDEIKEVVTDAFHAVVELYDHQQRSLPEEVQILDDNTEDAAVRHLLETVVPIHEVPRDSQKTTSAWL